MAPGLPDRVDCAQLAENSVVLERVYPLQSMPRLQDLLADAHGSVRARFAFARVDSERAGASVTVEATPLLVCQRCLRGFPFVAAGSSEVEFSSSMGLDASNSQRELYAMHDGSISLCELAEEELLLTLPIVAVCSAAESCGRAPKYAAVDRADGLSEPTRPFAALQDLLKKT
ncbi:MAG: YceD family protein [Gammaproteobacteria bacterium]